MKNAVRFYGKTIKELTKQVPENKEDKLPLTWKLLDTYAECRNCLTMGEISTLNLCKECHKKYWG